MEVGIEGVKMSIEELDLHAITDSRGFYFIETPPGKYDLLVSFSNYIELGYPLFNQIPCGNGNWPNDDIPFDNNGNTIWILFKSF